MTDQSLILLTNSFPYGKGETFLETEVKYLSKTFSKIFIFPSVPKDTIRTLPKNVMVIDSFFDNEKKSLSEKLFSYLSLLFSTIFWSEVFNLFSKGLFSLSNISKLSLFHRLAYRKFQILNLFIEREKLDKSLVALYSYWFVSHAMAIAFFKKKNPTAFGITRTHEYDLYQKGKNVLPFRHFMATYLDKIVPIAKDGKNYLQNQFGISASKIAHHNLGIENHFQPELNNVSNKEFVLLSCAFISERKRIPLIANAVKRAGELFPNHKFVWKHIGDGDLEITNEIQNIIKSFSKNVSAELLGYCSNQEIFEFYKRDTAISAFINVSTSEGKPVSIMEAQSFGVPVIATDVGGIRELVNQQNGHLLSPNPSVEEIANAIGSFLSPALLKEKKRNSFQIWKEEYNAQTNYTKFTEFLIKRV